MAPPTTNPYRWATNTGNRSAPTAGERILGWIAGAPILPRQLNDIIGSISDWVEHYAGTVVPYADLNIVYLWAAGMGWFTNDTIGTMVITRTAMAGPVAAPIGSVELEQTVGSSTSALFQHAGIAQGGAVNQVSVEVPAASGNTDYIVRIFDAAHTDASPKYQYWGATSSATGTVALSFIPGSSPGFAANTDPVAGPVNINGQIRPATPSGTVSIQSITVQFAPV